jgi:hypothetical protein
VQLALLAVSLRPQRRRKQHANGQQARLAVDLKNTHPDWPLTIVLRNTTVDEWFHTKTNVARIVHGDISDTGLVRSLSKEHDIVINAITSFDGDFARNIIAGMEERSEGPKGTLIHISGTGNFIDYSKTGNFESKSKVWNVSALSWGPSRASRMLTWIPTG